MSKTCPACEHCHAQTFFELRAMPVNIGVQWRSTEEALACRKGDLCLEFCPECGFIWNSAFDATQLEYSKHYDNSLDFSPVFQDYARSLAQRLIRSYDIRGKAVVELGCGKGHFLALLCEEGQNSGIGFDPSYEGERVRSAASPRIRYIQDFYGEAHTEHQGDLVCCRHVFEHIPDPLGFLSMVRRAIGEGRSTIVYFEVPNVRFILEQRSVWDVIYEHCNYFSAESLAAIFRRCGFEILRLEESYGGQFLSLDARFGGEAKGRRAPADLDGLQTSVQRFSAAVAARSKTWQDRLRALEANRTRAVVWGGGAKAVSFLNMLKVGDVIPYVVDINPHKQGLYLPGTGQRIVSPEVLREFQPQAVVLMNPIYREEIQQQLRALELSPELIDA
jgi:SAM-dependent methyltransferase